MLLTLSAQSYRSKLAPGKGALSLFDLPKIAREEFDLQGIVIQTSMLAGWDENKIDKLRDSADKAGSPVLLLIEDQPQPLADADKAIGESAVARLDRVVRVAHRLGCSGVALSILDPAGISLLEPAAARLKQVVSKAERVEVNLLIAPGTGQTATPEQLTGLIRKVGGFRIGSFPDFTTAAATPDPAAYLRSLAPYASAICVSLTGTKTGKKGGAYDLLALVESVAAVGYEGNMMLEYRGEGDPAPAILAAKEVILSISQEPTE